MATERVTFRGRAYRPAMPPSEQDDVLTVTRKLKNMTPVAAATVEITEDELRNFSRVYPRLYQVAPKNRNRLAEWGNRHEREVFEWDLDGFFTAKEDEEEGFVLRKPGCPEGVAEKVKRQREAKAADRQSDEQQPQQQKQKLSARRSGKARVAADPEVCLMFDRIFLSEALLEEHPRADLFSTRRSKKTCRPRQPPQLPLTTKMPEGPKRATRIPLQSLSFCWAA